MQELLEEKDLLHNKRVIKAYWGLVGKDRFAHSWVGPWKNPSTAKKFFFCTKCYERNICRVGIDESKCSIPDPIPGSLADIAIEMRDECVKRSIAGEEIYWNTKLGEITGNGDAYNIMLSTPEEWIKAAVLAWEEMIGMKKVTKRPPHHQGGKDEK